MRRLILKLNFILSLCVSTSLCASSATSFCKCTCKGNSTIIALNPQSSSSSSSSFSPNEPPSLSSRNPTQEREVEILNGRDEEETRKTHRASTCNDCNRKFCLDYKLPGCKGVREEEVFTTCFQRDSLKDETVVFVFIFATAGLLLWAFVKLYVQKWLVTAQERRSYIPLSGEEGTGSAPDRMTG
ncbi:hypothetical protein GJ744_008655 [Endocarpon pusillum]|uniref:AN1-type domain-containing protein n=1 Tax=Endocarpon pusillum TaxID=364733 RepID=A0A8H7AGV6_9EURO|nr:hypothetical protein GJ744_008655 [Endocarpon pusillum]